MKYNNEGLLDYLDFLESSKQKTITIDKEFLLELAQEVFYYRGLIDEMKEIDDLYHRISR
ncbi:MAG: hypothetical protein IKV70_08100 [Phascolarctobacterium sp.]|nr:hypothetical protein [Phascolarctobacterium sp.]